MMANRNRTPRLAQGATPEAGLVLPRLLRRPVRQFSRLLTGDIQIPRRFETMIFGSVIVGAVTYGAALGGQLPVFVEQVTVAIGVGVKEIEIKGHQHTRPEDIFAALGLDRQRSLFSIDPDQARIALAQLPWIESGQIRKTYPNTLEISVVEREPFAIWQTGETLSVVGEQGNVIGGYSGTSLRNLPLLVGKGAAETAADFIEIVAKFPVVHQSVRAYVRVGQRRWDLRLDNGLTLKLPETGVEDALARAVSLQAEHDIFGRDLASVDLRFADQVIFALTETAMDAREKALTQHNVKIVRERGSI